MNIRRVFEIAFTLPFLCLGLMQTACDTGLKHTSGIDSLILELYVNRSQARVGKPMSIRFTLTNTGKRLVTVEAQDTPVMDIVVDFSDGSELLTWSSHNPDQVARRLEWKPGESKTIEFVWIPKREDIPTGYYKNAYPSGRLYLNGKIVQSTGVTVCASEACPAHFPFWGD